MLEGFSARTCVALREISSNEERTLQEGRGKEGRGRVLKKQANLIESGDDDWECGMVVGGETRNEEEEEL